jgi:ABC-2 type transport system permease protein
MNKISVIIKREYITRVRKKSFIIMTILAPVLMAAIVILPTALMMNQDGDYKKIAVIEDNSDLFKGVVKNTKDAEFVYLENTKVEELKKTYEKAGYYGILWISPELVNTPNAIKLISKQQPPIGLLQHIESSLEKEIERQKLLAYYNKCLYSDNKNRFIWRSKRDKHRNCNGPGIHTWFHDVYAGLHFWFTGYEGSN